MFHVKKTFRMDYHHLQVKQEANLYTFLIASKLSNTKKYLWINPLYLYHCI